MMDWTPARIRALRRELGESVAVFGARLGRSGRTIEDWEQGRWTPTDPLVLRELLWLDAGVRTATLSRRV